MGNFGGSSPEPYVLTGASMQDTGVGWSLIPHPSQDSSLKGFQCVHLCPYILILQEHITQCQRRILPGRWVFPGLTDLLQCECTSQLLGEPNTHYQIPEWRKWLNFGISSLSLFMRGEGVTHLQRILNLTKAMPMSRNVKQLMLPNRNVHAMFFSLPSICLGCTLA